jgi:hypothetical protein
MDTTPSADIWYGCLFTAAGKLAIVMHTDWALAMLTVYKSFKPEEVHILEKFIESTEEAVRTRFRTFAPVTPEGIEARKRGDIFVCKSYKMTYNAEHQACLISSEYERIPPNTPHQQVFCTYQQAFYLIRPKVSKEDFDLWCATGASLNHTMQPAPLKPPVIKKAATIKQQRPPRQPKQPKQRKVYVGKPANHMTKWAPYELNKLREEVDGKPITVELVQSIADAHQRTFSAIQGRLFADKVITLEESKALSANIKGFSVDSASIKSVSVDSASTD